MVATLPGKAGLAGNGFNVLCETLLYVQLYVRPVETPLCPVNMTFGFTVVAKPVNNPQPNVPVVPIATTGVVVTVIAITDWVEEPVEPAGEQNSKTIAESPFHVNGVEKINLFEPYPVAAIAVNVAGAKTVVAEGVIAE
jgi:hypothetical protein